MTRVATPRYDGRVLDIDAATFVHANEHDDTLRLIPQGDQLFCVIEDRTGHRVGALVPDPLLLRIAIFEWLDALVLTGDLDALTGTAILGDIAEQGSETQLYNDQSALRPILVLSVRSVIPFQAEPYKVWRAVTRLTMSAAGDLARALPSE